jgi:ABC-type transport system involved in cytochrome c biogenesis ATPase subunit
MLTRLVIRGFKRFESAEIELGQSVVFVGANNSGKTTALQALALWQAGLAAWLARRTETEARERLGVTLNRRALTQIPVREARDLFTGRRATRDRAGKQSRLEVHVAGQDDTGAWQLGLRFQYANPESVLVRPLRDDASEDQSPYIPQQAQDVRIAFLPPMSGVISEEPEWAPGRIDVLIGEGQTAQVLRNLCLRVHDVDPAAWRDIVGSVRRMFGVDLLDPKRDPARGTVELRYREGNADFDVSAAGRGLQQVLLLLAHLRANRGAVLVLDEPDAHLEILRQREIYQLLTDTARTTGGQIVAASHSEVLLNAAADRDVVVAFVGAPHRIDDRGAQVLKALRDIPFDHYYQAEQVGSVLYLEGSTDLAILLAWARILNHPVETLLSKPFVHFVGNNYGQAQSHFFGLREAMPDLRGFALFDRLDRGLPSNFPLKHHVWRKREIENYLTSRTTLLRYAGGQEADDLVGCAVRGRREDAMRRAIDEIEAALRTLDRNPWGPDLKVSEEFLPQVFRAYFRLLGVPDRTNKSDFHILAASARAEDIDPEVQIVLDKIHAALVAERTCCVNR